MAQTQPQPLTILIIEDDPATLEFLDMFLGISGYAVRSAGTGEEGLALAPRSNAQAILLDRRLPDMDGVEVCVQLRTRLGPAVPIIMMTADRDLGLEAMAHRAGATAFIRKPFAPDLLLIHLAAVLPT